MSQDPFVHIKAAIQTEVDKEGSMGLSKKRAGHWIVDNYFYAHIITPEVHEALHQWVNQKVAVKNG